MLITDKLTSLSEAAETYILCVAHQKICFDLGKLLSVKNCTNGFIDWLVSRFFSCAFAKTNNIKDVP